MGRAVVALVTVVLLFAAGRTAADVVADMAERGLRGKVVDPDGKPVAGAVVKCAGVRTPGEGIFGDRPPAPVTTDATGRFLLLPPTKDLVPFDGPAPGPGGLRERLPQHGDLLPANSTFTIDVDIPADDRFFPYHGEHPNVGLHVIRLQRVERSRTLRLEAPEGGFVTDRNVLASVRLLYRPAGGGDGYWLEAKYLGGGKLAPGTYQAESEALRYAPLVVSAESPAELVMKLQPPPTYEGRVVDGVTGEPLAGAIVIGMTATGDGRLADLEPADWDALELRPSGDLRPEQVMAAWAKVYRAYSFDLRAPTTGADGRFVLPYKPGLKVPYGLIVVARDRLPMLCRNYAARPEPDGRVAVRDVPLFPAARVAISIGFNRDPANPRASAGLSVNPEWELSPVGQPAWFGAFKAAADGGERQWDYAGWIPLNRRSHVLVPAGLTLNVRLDAPYDDQWCPLDLPGPIRLNAGEVRDLGPVAVAEGLLATVRVTDAAGRPVEGAPVRKIGDRKNCWTVVHNTDARGEVKFYVRPNSTGRFGIIDLKGLGQQNLPAKLVVPYRVGEKLEGDGAFRLQMTPQQVDLLTGPRPGAT